MCFGKSFSWGDLCVKLHLTSLILLMGADCALPQSGTDCGSLICNRSGSCGYVDVALVSVSLRLGSLLKSFMFFGGE